MSTKPKEKKHATPADLATEVALLADVIRRAPPAKLQLSGSTDWGAREIFGHLVFWHAQYASIIAAMLVHRRPRLLAGSFKSLNAYSVELYKDCTIEEMLASLETSQRSLDRFAHRKGIDEIRFAFREGSQQRSYREFLDVITRHFRRHRSHIRRLVKPALGRPVRRKRSAT